MAYYLNIIVSSGRSLQYTPALFQGVMGLPSPSKTSSNCEMELSKVIYRSIISLLPPRVLTTSRIIPQSVATGEVLKLLFRSGSYVDVIVPAALSDSRVPSSTA